MEKLIKGIADAINQVSAENGSNTPDFILGEFLADCLTAFDRASRRREKWYGMALEIGGAKTIPEQETKTLADAKESPAPSLSLAEEIAAAVLNTAWPKFDVLEAIRAVLARRGVAGVVP